MFLHNYTVYVIDVLLNATYIIIIKCQWLEYVFIDILNTDEELCALSLFTFSYSQMLLKLASCKTDI